MIESAIPEIIALALDEKDDVYSSRIASMQLLAVYISAAPLDSMSPTFFSFDPPFIPWISQLVRWGRRATSRKLALL